VVRPYRFNWKQRMTIDAVGTPATTSRQRPDAMVDAGVPTAFLSA